MKKFLSGVVPRAWLQPAALSVAMLFVLTCCCYGQDSAAGREAHIIPPSPNSAAIEKFGVNPVNYATGIPEIGYPMWTWNRGKLTLPLGLKYHAGGNKVQDLPGNVGLGWALSTSYRVSRTVRGLNDDMPNYGFMNSPVLPELVTDQYDNDYYYILQFINWQQAYNSNIGITPLNSPYSDLVREVGLGKTDGEQDVFSYSFPTGSGKFIIDKQKNIVPLEYTNSKFSMTFNSQANAIATFTVTDDKGLEYHYTNREMHNFQIVTTSQAVPENYLGDYVSGWLLTYIIDPQVKDTIQFVYTTVFPPNVHYETGFRETRTLRLTAPGTSGAYTPNYQEESVGSYDLLELDEPQLVEIRLPDGSKINMEYDFNRNDLKNAKALTQATVTNMNNEIVKKYRMYYSYFQSSGASPFIPYESGNDYSIRLRLDSISELPVSGPLAKVTRFTYESTPINPRNSSNLDHWGYNVNPARGNSVRSSRIKLEPTEYGMNTAYGVYWPGANLYPDSVYVKAGVLQQITHPTGGYTSFEYECNRAFSAVDYYNDTKVSNTLTWQLNEFNAAKSITLPGRNRERIRLFVKANEPNPRPAPGSGPVSCIGGMQDEKVVRFQIINGTHTSIVNLDVVYSQLIGGATFDVDLPVNDIYTVKAVYDAGVTCAYMYPFTLQASASYEVDVYDKLVGGVRIKKIQSFDGTGKNLKKEYFYTDSSGRSSATLAIVPDYRYHRQTTGYTGGQPSKAIVRSTSPAGTLNFFNGSPLIYKRVIELESNGSYTERLYDPAYEGQGPTAFYPYLPIQDFPLLSGTLIKENIADASGVVKMEKSYTYNKVASLLGNDNRNMVVGLIASGGNYPAKMWVVDNYRPRVSWIEPLTEVVKTNSSAGSITVQTSKTYDSRHYLSNKKVINSKSQELNEGYYYSHSQQGAVYDFMRQKNILYALTGKNTSIALGSQYLNEVRENYALFNSGVLPELSAKEERRLESSWFPSVTYNSYDDKGNVLQYTGKDGVVTSFFWSYNKQYPVARVVGKTYSDLVSLSGINLGIVSNPASEAALLAELNKLRLVNGAMVTSYLYKPQVGIKREIDVNGKSIFYEYDVFNRLNLIRDNNNNIIKKYCYNYQGQQTECSESVTAGCVNCTGASQKCINGVCETGVKNVTGSVRLSTNSWQCTFHYTWSDGTSSPSYTEISSMGCLLGVPGGV